MSEEFEFLEAKPEKPAADNAELLAAFKCVEQERVKRRKMKNGRGNLLVIAALSTANVLLILFGASTMFAFALFLPAFIVGVGSRAASGLQGGGVMLAAMSLSLAIVAALWLMWALSKRHIVPVWLFAVIYALDTAALFVIGISSGMMRDFIIDFLFHIWAMASIALHLSFRIREKRGTLAQAKDVAQL